MLDEPIGDLGDGGPHAPRLIVDVWLAVPTQRGLRVLLLERSEAHGAFWQGVSGGVEAEDETLRGAALREIEEEIGSVPGLTLFDLGRWIAFVSPYSGRSFRKRSLGALLTAATTPETITLSEEHVAAQLVTFDEARAMVRWDVNRQELSDFEGALRDVRPPEQTPPAQA